MNEIVWTVQSACAPHHWRYWVLCVLCSFVRPSVRTSIRPHAPIESPLFCRTQSLNYIIMYHYACKKATTKWVRFCSISVSALLNACVCSCEWFDFTREFHSAWNRKRAECTVAKRRSFIRSHSIVDNFSTHTRPPDGPCNREPLTDPKKITSQFNRKRRLSVLRQQNMNHQRAFEHQLSWRPIIAAHDIVRPGSASKIEKSTLLEPGSVSFWATANERKLYVLSFIGCLHRHRMATRIQHTRQRRPRLAAAGRYALCHCVLLQSRAVRTNVTWLSPVRRRSSSSSACTIRY